MFQIDTDSYEIEMIRGDTAAFQICLNDYELQEDDIMVMTVKKRKTDQEPLLTKYAEGNVIVLEPDDTINLVGKCVYDIQLTTSVGAVYTPILSTITFQRGVTE